MRDGTYHAIDKVGKHYVVLVAHGGSYYTQYGHRIDSPRRCGYIRGVRSGPIPAGFRPSGKSMAALR